MATRKLKHRYVQSFGIIVTYGRSIVTGQPIWWSYLTICVCSAAGTAFLMWLGERITEKGIGNGISMLIFASIVSRVPDWIIERFRLLFTGVQVWQFFVALIVIIALITSWCSSRRRSGRSPSCTPSASWAASSTAVRTPTCP